MGSFERQRGFVRSSVMDLAFLFILILIGLALWQFFSTVVSGDFPLVFFMVWLVVTALAWWWSRNQPLLLRVPVGFLVYLAAVAVLLPLSWWPGSRLILALEAAVAGTLPGYLGGWCARLLQPRLAAPPWYLDQRINLMEDLGRWLFVSTIAWFAVGLLPLLLVFVLPLEWIPWAAQAWALAVLVWYLYKQRPSRMRLLKVPLGLWVFVGATVLLKLLQSRLAGPLEAGSIGAVAYAAYAPLVAAFFAEIVVVGTLRR
jgi:hypothetical protein